MVICSFEQGPEPRAAKAEGEMRYRSKQIREVVHLQSSLLGPALE